VDIKDKYGRTPLIRAASSGFLNICKRFISRGADVGKPNIEGDNSWQVAR